MTQERINRLQEIGFDFGPPNSTWDWSFVSFIGHRVLSIVIVCGTNGWCAHNIIVLNHWARQISLSTGKNMATVCCHIDMNQTHPLEYG